MKKLITVFLLTGSTLLQAQEWKNDLNDALKEASVQNKNVLVFFSVPDACATCGDLERIVFESDDFKLFAKENYVLFRPDFPISVNHPISAESKAENLLIVEKYNKDGFFPLVVILDKNARTLGKTGVYDGETPKQYIAILQALEKK